MTHAPTPFDLWDRALIYDVILPKLGTNMTEATVVRWLKREGDPVAAGEPLAEVETEKAVFEIEAEAPGVLRRILAQPGETVPVALPVAVIADRAEDLAEHLEAVARLRAGSAAESRHGAETHARWFAGGRPGPAVAEPLRRPDDRVLASPAARRLAAQVGVDLAAVARTLGPGRTIQEDDVRRAAEAVPIAIFGAGLGAAQVMDVLRFLPQFRIAALVDDNPALWDTTIRGYPVYGLGRLNVAADRGEVRAVVVSLHSRFRRGAFERIRAACPSVELPALVHPNAYLGDGVVVEDGVLVEAGAVVGTETVLGRGTIVDMGAVVSHHCDVGPFCHLAPHCTVSGDVKIKENAVLMAGAIAGNNTTIGRNVVVTPGSVVATDVVPDDVVVHGNPARVIGKSKRGQ
ncbi:MAG: E3 binding domain-containing protein [Chloroflexi bacterium]|nr:E3 binding domain-containing protein [Chloroflexota bacterium]